MKVNLRRLVSFFFFQKVWKALGLISKQCDQSFGGLGKKTYGGVEFLE